MKYFLPVFIILLFSCSKIEVERNPLYFFWEEMDKKYAFFEEKQINWDSIRGTLPLYDPNINSDLVSGFTEMITPLRDRHVWVNTGEEIITYITEDYIYSSINLEFYSSGRLEENDIYSIAQLPGGIVFIELKTFFSQFPYFEKTVKDYDYSNGIIIDIRHNSGGYQKNVLELASNFISGKHTVLYLKHKNGKGHTDFTTFKPISLEGSDHFSDTKIVLLIDKMTYSAANMFVSVMKNFTDAILVGDKTGGGGASSTQDILPNGWIYSISQNAYFDSDFRSLEPGILPHYRVPFDMKQFEEQKPRHNQMEFAFQLLADDN
jgi:hypothetical protein